MALSITKNFEMSAGGKQFRFITVTHDESTSTFTAKDVGMDYIAWVMAAAPYIASTCADVSAYMGATTVSITGNNGTVRFTLPPKPASKSTLVLVGW